MQGCVISLILLIFISKMFLHKFSVIEEVVLRIPLRHYFLLIYSLIQKPRWFGARSDYLNLENERRQPHNRCFPQSYYVFQAFKWILVWLVYQSSTSSASTQEISTKKESVMSAKLLEQTVLRACGLRQQYRIPTARFHGNLEAISWDWNSELFYIGGTAGNCSWILFFGLKWARWEWKLRSFLFFIEWTWLTPHLFSIEVDWYSSEMSVMQSGPPPASNNSGLQSISLDERSNDNKQRSMIELTTLPPHDDATSLKANNHHPESATSSLMNRSQSELSRQSSEQSENNEDDSEVAESNTAAKSKKPPPLEVNCLIHIVIWSHIENGHPWYSKLRNYCRYSICGFCTL